MAGKYTGPRRELVIRDSDLIWVARMLVGEGGYKLDEEEAAAALWAMANRYLLHPKQKNWKNFTALLRAFSQPINPLWDGILDNQSGMDKCDPSSKWYGSKHCSASSLKRRERMRTITWEEIPLRVRNWVVEFQNGVLFPPDQLGGLRKARISNWGANWLKKSRDGEVMPLPEWAPHGIDFGGNWFFEDANLIDGYVDVESDPNAPRSKPKASVFSIAFGIITMSAGILGAKLLTDYLSNR